MYFARRARLLCRLFAGTPRTGRDAGVPISRARQGRNREQSPVLGNWERDRARFIAATTLRLLASQ
jgi:hypothetical protein